MQLPSVCLPSRLVRDDRGMGCFVLHEPDVGSRLRDLASETNRARQSCRCSSAANVQDLDWTMRDLVSRFNTTCQPRTKSEERALSVDAPM